MTDIKSLEEKYLKAKIAYYEGKPLMTDSEFDILEKVLKERGSKVMEQVGAKRKDFDFPHPYPMLSLSKLQTEQIEKETDYKEIDFKNWYNKKSEIARSYPNELISSPKFDGNAINIIYRNNKLTSILTRGDGKHGKDITERLKKYVPSKLKLADLVDVIEVRAEIVMPKSIFEAKYKNQFANPRNYIAGLLGADEFDQSILDDTKIIHVNILWNGKYVKDDVLSHHLEFNHKWFRYFNINDYKSEIKYYERLRDEIDYPLDGVVISFPHNYREILGENEHDPEWSIAIKFIPEEVMTKVNGIEWNVSKLGEINPVVLLEPVWLDGSTVKRASGYNYGYIVKNKIGPGSIVSIAKAGDIIPEIQKVIVESDKIEVPDFCPACGELLSKDDIHLICTNPYCKGKIAKQLSAQIKVLGIKGIGEKMIEPFAKDFDDIIRVIRFFRTAYGKTSAVEQYGIKYDSKTHHNFIKIFSNIKSIPLYKVIQLIGFEGVGNKLSKQLEKELCGLPRDYSHLEKELVEKMKSEESKELIFQNIKLLEDVGIKIERPVKEEKKDENVYGICLTGSPKSAGYKTKKEFLEKFNGIYETSLSDENCKYLITDSYESTSSKMKTAKKKKIEIITYNDFKK